MFSGAGEAGIAPPSAKGGAISVRAPGVGDGAPLGGEEEEDDDVPAGVAELVESEAGEEVVGSEAQPEAPAPGAPPAQLAPRLRRSCRRCCVAGSHPGAAALKHRQQS